MADRNRRRGRDLDDDDEPIEDAYDSDSADDDDEFDDDPDDVADDESDDDEADEDDDERPARRGRAATATRARAAKSTRVRTGTAPGFLGAIVRRFRETVAELQKVIWPTRKELLTYASVVIIFAAIIMSFVAGLDLGFAKLMFVIFGSGEQ